MPGETSSHRPGDFVRVPTVILKSRAYVSISMRSDGSMQRAGQMTHYGRDDVIIVLGRRGKDVYGLTTRSTFWCETGHMEAL